MNKLLKAVGNAPRVRIVDALLEQGELQVKEIMAATGISQSIVSQSLIIMEGCGVLSKRKVKTNVFCSINPKAKEALATVRKLSVKHESQLN